jgi:hypothetical protein
MATKDLNSHISDLVAVNGGTISSSTTTTGVIIDTSGYEGLEFLLRTSAWTDGTYTLALTHGDDSALADGATVAAAGLIGTLPALAAANKTGRVGYRGHKRYVRADVVSTGVSSGAHVSATALLAHPLTGPTV